MRNPAAWGIALIGAAAIAIISFNLFFASESSSALVDANGQVVIESNATAGQSGHICVHVTGCVISPGLVRLPAPARVYDAIDAAGGFSDDADTQALNIARILSDGEQIVVPQAGLSAGGDASAGSFAHAGSDTGSYIGDRLNINRASQAELESLCVSRLHRFSRDRFQGSVALRSSARVSLRCCSPLSLGSPHRLLRSHRSKAPLRKPACSYSALGS